MVHGDIKGVSPLAGIAGVYLTFLIQEENVLIADDGRTLLTDFGLSFIAEPSVTTAPDRVGGTLRWMAPEVLDDAIFPRSDVWSYGMTILVRSTFRTPVLDNNGVFNRKSSPRRNLSTTFLLWLFGLELRRDLRQTAQRRRQRVIS